MPKQKTKGNNAKFVLPVLAMFAILTIGRADVGSFGGSGYLTLRPTLPMLSSGGSLGSFGFSYSGDVVQPSLSRGGSLGSVSFSATSNNIIQPNLGGPGGVGAVNLVGGYGFVQPNLGPSGGIGSIRLSGGSGLQPNIGGSSGIGSIRLSGPRYYTPSYSSTNFGSFSFGYKAQPRFYETIYTTPSRALINTGISYNNLGRAF